VSTQQVFVPLTVRLDGTGLLSRLGGTGRMQGAGRRTEVQARLPVLCASRNTYMEVALIQWRLGDGLVARAEKCQAQRQKLHPPGAVRSRRWGGEAVGVKLRKTLRGTVTEAVIPWLD